MAPLVGNESHQDCGGSFDMTLTLKVISSQQFAMGPNGIRVFSGQGGRIGRSSSGDWVLPDEERYLSGCHCMVHFRDGAYYLEDTSTNGVYVNAASEPLGKGQQLLLHDGDLLGLGDYEIAVAISAAAVQSARPAAVAPMDDDPFSFGSITDRSFSATQPTYPAHIDSSAPGGASAVDPLALFDKYDTNSDWRGAGKGGAGAFPSDDGFLSDLSGTGSREEQFGAQVGAQTDHLAAIEHAFRPPDAHWETIPDDWDLTPEIAVPPPIQPASIAQPSQASVPPPPPVPSLSPSAEIVAPAMQPAALPVGAAVAVAPVVQMASMTSSGDAGVRAFLEGVGLADQPFAPEQGLALMNIFGKMTRQMVQGMMEMLRARASLKSEFRIPTTILRPVENNPLKHHVTADDALRTMFVRQDSGYMPPLAAIQDGFDDIKGHEMALMAGMQAALAALLQRFNPREIEEQSDKGSRLGSLLPAAKKARAWEFYAEFYAALVREAEDDFQALLGEEFARAYEEQMEKIDSLRSR